MIEIRCIKAIDGHEVDDIIDITDGIAFAHRGASGVLTVQDFGEGNVIIFAVEHVVSTPTKKIRVQNHQSMHMYFTFDTVIPEPVDPPPTTIDCNLPLSVSIESNATYKYYSAPHTYIKLIIDTIDPLEFSSKSTASGFTSGLNSSGYPITWTPIAKVSGFYNVPVPSTGVQVQAIFARKVGCTGNGTQLNYSTFNSDGTDPLFPSGGGGGEVGIGGLGTGTAVSGHGTGNKPLGITVWGFFAGRFREPFNGEAEHIHKTHYAEQSAMSDPLFREQRPFFSIDGTYTKDGGGNLQIVTGEVRVPVGIYSNVARTHIVQERMANCDWQMGQKEMDWCIEYIVRSGLQYMKFEYYANGYDGAGMRTLFEQNPNKRGVKASYVVGQFGGDVNNYDDPNDDYRKNIEHFTWAMGQPWYQQIDGKPLIFLFKEPYDHPSDTTPQQTFKAAFALELGRIRSLYASKYGGGGIYEVYMTAGLNNDYSLIDANSMDARSWYYTFDEEANGTHLMSSPNTKAYNQTVALSAIGKEIVPSLNIALDGRARAMYPGDKYQVGTPDDGYGINYNPATVNGYYIPPTMGEIAGIIASNVELLNLSGVKTAVFANFDELSEAGITCLMPKLRNNGTVNSEVVNAFKGALNPTYPTTSEYSRFS
jgi:hypothetical protein